MMFFQSLSLVVAGFLCVSDKVHSSCRMTKRLLAFESGVWWERRRGLFHVFLEGTLESKENVKNFV